MMENKWYNKLLEHDFRTDGKPNDKKIAKAMANFMREHKDYLKGKWENLDMVYNLNKNLLHFFSDTTLNSKDMRRIVSDLDRKRKFIGYLESFGLIVRDTGKFFNLYDEQDESVAGQFNSLEKEVLEKLADIVKRRETLDIDIFQPIVHHHMGRGFIDFGVSRYELANILEKNLDRLGDFGIKVVTPNSSLSENKKFIYVGK
ncbi:hypothetical protein [Fictibacillus fluitans]|uniref:Uncharacterized protein n=1 Tax=Fictibacillus fluitans TaxID=3058422 RepID=A0ABT8HRN1_9BACL|nr:hypothetical protein [Fictibacillus sp. NE201]MDN4523175.1 hypothetical protein [Fictibacillus sp. NE201]